MKCIIREVIADGVALQSAKNMVPILFVCLVFILHETIDLVCELLSLQSAFQS